MNDYVMGVLLTIALLGACRELQNAWFLYQVRKRRREEVRARLFRLVSDSPTHKDAA